MLILVGGSGIDMVVIRKLMLVLILKLVF